MKVTTKETLAKAEYWSMEAMRCIRINDRQRELLRQANDLIKEAYAIEEETAQQRAYKAAQII